MTEISERTGITWVSQVVNVIFIILGLAYFLYFWGCFLTVQDASSHGIIQYNLYFVNTYPRVMKHRLWSPHCGVHSVNYDCETQNFR